MFCQNRKNPLAKNHHAELMDDQLHLSSVVQTSEKEKKPRSWKSVNPLVLLQFNRNVSNLSKKLLYIFLYEVNVILSIYFNYSKFEISRLGSFGYLKSASGVDRF